MVATLDIEKETQYFSQKTLEFVQILILDFIISSANGFPGFLSLGKNPWVYGKNPWVYGKNPVGKLCFSPKSSENCRIFEFRARICLSLAENPWV